jgi:branched-chain amino acid transport system ATP-binding protein
MTDAVLRATNVSVEFAGLRALDDVSIDIAVGEIVGLIGPNGSGKTTLVNVLTGQVRPVAGKVTCVGRDITNLPPHVIARHGVTRSFQIVRLFKNMTVLENAMSSALACGASLRKARDLASSLLDEFGLFELRNEIADTLNYGDERRVEIVRGLAAEPRFLLLDEPAAGMNHAEGDKLLGLLSELPGKHGLGMLIIDHDVPLIMRLCHRLHVLASGMTIGEGDVDTVRRLPAVVEAYLGSTVSDEAAHA